MDGAYSFPSPVPSSRVDLPVIAFPLREVSREKRFGQRPVDLVKKLEDRPRIVVRKGKPLFVHQLVGERFENFQRRPAVAGLDGGPCLFEEVSKFPDIGFHRRIRIGDSGSTPLWELEDVPDLAPNRFPVDGWRTFA